MRATLGLTAAVVLFTAPAWGGGAPGVGVDTKKDGNQVISTLVQTKKDGNQVITNLDPIKAPVVNGEKFPDASATGVVLDAFDWKCGQAFTDQYGRRWFLAFGPPYSEKPAKIAGWEIETNNKQLFFMTVNGRLYRYLGPTAAVVQPAVVPKVVVPPGIFTPK